jgi:hypothetical protein
MKSFSYPLACTFVLFVCDGPVAMAQGVTTGAESSAASQAKNPVEKSGEEQLEEEGFFKDMSTGIALIKPKRKTVRDASVINGKVVVNSESKVESTLLVAKTFPFSRTSYKRCQGPATWASCAAFMVGVGFNIGTQGSAGQVIDYLGVGLTVGSGQDAGNKSAWYAGIGLGRRFNQKVLADGFVENQALPVGETQIRFKHIDATAPFAFISLRW